MTVCQDCNGQGIVWECYCRYKSEEEQSNCSNCDGMGWIDCPRLDDEVVH